MANNETAHLQQNLHQALHWAVPSLWKLGKVLGKAWGLQSSVFLHSLLFKWLLINEVQKMALKWLMMSANIAAWKCHIAVIAQREKDPALTGVYSQ